MKSYQLFIDGGTTNTKFILLKKGEVVDKREVQAGASDAENNRHNTKLEETIKETISILETKYQGRITDIYASGMITSNVGLYEVKHVQSPVCAKDLKEKMVSINLPQIHKKAVFHFIPGICFQNNQEIGIDICRGEETEVFGIVKESKEGMLILHFGSHNKIIYAKNGSIRSSITTIGGELLWAISRDTIVRSAVGDIEKEFPLHAEYVKKGYYEAQKSGISRAMFLLRINRVIYDAGEEEVKSYLYGAILAADIQAFMNMPFEKAMKIVLYGRDTFIKTFSICREYLPEKMQVLPVEKIAFEESRKLALLGLKTILEAK